MRALLEKAVKIALKKQDKRSHKVGAVGVRSDGVIVASSNGPVREGKFPRAHAEARLCRKLDRGAVVFVARVNSKGDWRLARPCPSCRRVLRQHGVKKVIFTVNPLFYGVIHL
jgi:tRNA(Arg) A34 adenosine deaminase TadA